MLHEFKDFCLARSEACTWLAERKFFPVRIAFRTGGTLIFQIFFQFKMVFPDWHGYLVGFGLGRGENWHNGCPFSMKPSERSTIMADKRIKKRTR